MTWKFERIAGPYQGSCGGLSWDGSGMLFSVPSEGKIFRYDPISRIVIEKRKYTHHTYGIAIGPDNILYGCQENGRRIVSFMQDGSTRLGAYKIDEKFHNAPSDLTIDSSGRIWFSDPYPSRLIPGPELYPFLNHASVLCMTRVPRQEWKLQRVTLDTKAPRSVLLSQNEKTLFVGEGEVGTPGLRELRAYPILDNGFLGSYQTLHTFGTDHLGDQRGIEGMCLNYDGSIVACAGWQHNGPGPLIYIFSPNGVVVKTIPFPEGMPMRCAFGDDGLKSFYVTSSDGCVYRVSDSGLRGNLRI